MELVLKEIFVFGIVIIGCIHVLHNALLNMSRGTDFKIVCLTYSNGLTCYVIQGYLAGRWRDVYVNDVRANFGQVANIFLDKQEALEKLSIANRYIGRVGKIVRQSEYH